MALLEMDIVGRIDDDGICKLEENDRLGERLSYGR